MISRDPEFYFPSDHAYNRAKQRGIDFEIVAETIESGQVKDAYGSNCKLFVKEIPTHENPIGVIADVETGKIITIEHRE